MAELLLLTRWTWAELQETPADVVDAVIHALNRRRLPPPDGEPRVEL